MKKDLSQPGLLRLHQVLQASEREAEENVTSGVATSAGAPLIQSAMNTNDANVSSFAQSLSNTEGEEKRNRILAALLQKEESMKPSPPQPEAKTLTAAELRQLLQFESNPSHNLNTGVVDQTTALQTNDNSIPDLSTPLVAAAAAHFMHDSQRSLAESARSNASSADSKPPAKSPPLTSVAPTSLSRHPKDKDLSQSEIAEAKRITAALGLQSLLPQDNCSNTTNVAQPQRMTKDPSLSKVFGPAGHALPGTEAGAKDLEQIVRLLQAQTPKPLVGVVGSPSASLSTNTGRRSSPTSVHAASKGSPGQNPAIADAISNFLIQTKPSTKTFASLNASSTTGEDMKKMNDFQHDVSATSLVATAPAAPEQTIHLNPSAAPQSASPRNNTGPSDSSAKLSANTAAALLSALAAGGAGAQPKTNDNIRDILKVSRLAAASAGQAATSQQQMTSTLGARKDSSSSSSSGMGHSSDSSGKRSSRKRPAESFHVPNPQTLAAPVCPLPRKKATVDETKTTDGPKDPPTSKRRKVRKIKAKASRSPERKEEDKETG